MTSKKALWESIFMRLAVAAGLAMTLSLPASAQSLRMTIDASKTGAPITPLIYGQFTENANSNFYHGGLWAEMLEDRKFYYPITDTPPAAQTAQGRGRPAPFSPWRPIGGDGVVAMDLQRAYSGQQSARIALDPAVPHGIAQNGLAVLRGKQYTGRIVLASDVAVDVSLIWGPAPQQRQTLKIAGAGNAYRTFPLAFTSAADSSDATIEILATGRGSFNIGAISLMPADNIHGWRADSVRALQEIGPTNIRYGGNFISDYDWSKGVGDPDRRPSTFDFAWKQMDTNDVGTDEILALTKLLNAEPYMNVNAGFGDAKSAAEWLEYVNGATTTPMGKLRAANGHPEPYKVKWWNIGNEMYGPWQLGQMQIEQYAIKHNLFAQAMRKVDPSITIVGVGATPEEMGTTRAAASYGTSIVEFGSAQDWDSVMLSKDAANFDDLSEHLYPKGNQAFDAAQGKFVGIEESQADHARRLPNRVKMTVEAWQEYEKRFPNLDMKKIQIALDEWRPGDPGGSRSPMFSALSSAEALNEISRNSEWFALSDFTHLTGLVSGRTETTILPIGRMFELYRHHFGSIPVAVTGNAPQRELQGTLNVDKPKVSSGSDTYPLDVAAAWTADRKLLTVAVVNPTDSEQRISIAFKGVTFAGGGKLLRLVAPQGPPPAQASGQPPRQPETTIVQAPLSQIGGELVVPKQSISIYELPAH